MIKVTFEGGTTKKINGNIMKIDDNSNLLILSSKIYDVVSETSDEPIAIFARGNYVFAEKIEK